MAPTTAPACGCQLEEAPTGGTKLCAMFATIETRPPRAMPA
jgi:hypothetical protein